jgi:hypothetical protein
MSVFPKTPADKKGTSPALILTLAILIGFLTFLYIDVRHRYAGHNLKQHLDLDNNDFQRIYLRLPGGYNHADYRGN